MKKKLSKVFHGSAMSYLVRSLIVTAVAALLTYWALPQLLELSAVMSARGQEDFSITDLYNKLAVDRQKKDNGQVACINYEGGSRKEIAVLLDQLTCDTSRMPSVIALDFYFSSPKDPAIDSQLIQSLINASRKTRVVMPYIVKYNKVEQNDTVNVYFSSDYSSYFNHQLAQLADNLSFGVINLAGNYFTDVMREFRFDFPITDSDDNLVQTLLSLQGDTLSMRSIPAEIALQKYIGDKKHLLLLQNPDAEVSEKVVNQWKAEFENLVSMHYSDVQNKHITINYMSDTLLVFNAEQLLDTAADASCSRDEILDFVSGRAVLIGSLYDVKDTYITPRPDLQAGVLVHAYGANTILAEQYVDAVPKNVCIILAIIICFLFTLLNCLACDKGKVAGNAIVRLMQFCAMVIIIWCGYKLFVERQIYLDFNISIAMLLTSIMTFDVIMAIELLARWLKKHLIVFYGKILLMR